MWKSMKQRIYIIAALALVNITIMKYNESKGKDKADTLAVAKERSIVTDSLIAKP